MGWDKIQNDLGAIWHRAKQAATGAAQDVGAESGKVGSDVASFTEGLIDDLRGRSLTGPSFPHELNVPTPTTHMALVPGARQPVIGSEGLTLDNKTPLSSFGLHMNAAGNARLDLEAAGPGTDWGEKGRESAVLSVYVDGKYQQDVVLWGGSKDTPYALSLGKLGAGDHTVTLRYAREKSTQGAKGIHLSSGTATAATYPTKEAQWAADYAPVLYGRSGLSNNHTDTPLGLYYSTNQNPDGTTTLSYSYAYSNEDGGTAASPALEQARWGRLTDLQHVLNVTVDANGKVVSEIYEGAGHHDHAFTGEHDGTHPVIRTATGNNNVTDQGGGPMRFMQPPDHLVDDRAPTEDLMRQNPRWFETMAKEVQREGKVDPKGVGDKPDDSNLGVVKTWLAQHGLGSIPQSADPRHYLYVQFNSANGSEDPINVRVQLKNGTWLDSDLGVSAAAIARDGWAQTAVRLPPGTRPEDVAKVEFASLGKDKARIDRVGHLYMLDSRYEPQEVRPTIANP